MTIIQVTSGISVIVGLYKLFYTPMNRYSLELQKNSMAVEQLTNNLERYGNEVYDLERRQVQSEKDIVVLKVKVDTLEKKGE